MNKRRWGRHRVSPGGSWWRPVAVIVLPVVGMTALALLVFLVVLDRSSPEGRLELIRTALAVGAGTGAIMTLVLAWRRQWATEHDAVERRLTELYVKAVEQLGSDKAAVRHGALYALERVAQDNPNHRQTVVEVICAYLRAPFNPLTGKSGTPSVGLPARSLLSAPGRRVVASSSISRHTTLASPRLTRSGEERREEREVRRTAQSILTRHLIRGPEPSRRPLPTFWPDIDLDLAGATLVNFDLNLCYVRHARFTQANFLGDTRFDWSHFRDAWFNEAHFAGNAWFDRAHFDKDARFDGTRFNACARFVRAVFSGNVRFEEAHFGKEVEFDEARFIGNAEFAGAIFAADIRFDEAWVHVDNMRSDIWPAGWTVDTETTLGSTDGRLNPLVREKPDTMQQADGRPSKSG